MWAILKTFLFGEKLSRLLRQTHYACLRKGEERSPGATEQRHNGASHGHRTQGSIFWHTIMLVIGPLVKRLNDESLGAVLKGLK